LYGPKTYSITIITHHVLVEHDQKCGQSTEGSIPSPRKGTYGGFTAHPQKQYKGNIPSLGEVVVVSSNSTEAVTMLIFSKSLHSAANGRNNTTACTSEIRQTRA